MSIAKCCMCGESIITTMHIKDKSKALCGICLFDNAFNEAWEKADRLSVGHSDYWDKMKLRVKNELKDALLGANE